MICPSVKSLTPFLCHAIITHAIYRIIFIDIVDFNDLNCCMCSLTKTGYSTYLYTKLSSVNEEYIGQKILGISTRSRNHDHMTTLDPYIVHFVF